MIMKPTIERLAFPGHSGESLAARLDMPVGPVRAYAVFAHCFTCGKDILASRRIAVELAKSGIAVLRFDFTGLGASKGDFAETNFSTNVADLVAAAQHLGEAYRAPEILIGHSLGGAAVLAAAIALPSIKAVVTIGAPADVGHVVHNFGSNIQRIEEDGEAVVSLAGRPFRIKQQFLDDVRGVSLTDCIKELKRPLLVLHSPLDDTVGIENAGAIFGAAKHPKSFVSLDGADHLLTSAEDASYAAGVIAGWVGRFIKADSPDPVATIEHIRVSETGEGRFQNMVMAGRHRMFADEPVDVGGLDSGPSPYDLLGAALASCTSMTIRMYADFKKIKLGRVSVDVQHAKIHARDCAECAEDQRNGGGKVDTFTRKISIEGGIPDELADKLVEIANKCPVHRTLEASAVVHTELV
jgi:putative redox protein